MAPNPQNQIFSQWLAEHGGMLHHVANAFASGADRHDLMQELLLALWRAVPSYRAESRPSTFIYRIAHNCALSWQRGQRNYGARLDRFERSLPTAIATGAALDEAADLERMYECLRGLPPLDRSLIVLHLDDRSYEEIAEIHGISVNNVGVRLNRLKRRIASMLNSEVTP